MDIKDIQLFLSVETEIASPDRAQNLMPSQSDIDEANAWGISLDAYLILSRESKKQDIDKKLRIKKYCEQRQFFITHVQNELQLTGWQKYKNKSIFFEVTNPKKINDIINPLVKNQPAVLNHLKIKFFPAEIIKSVSNAKAGAIRTTAAILTEQGFTKAQSQEIRILHFSEEIKENVNIFKAANINKNTAEALRDQQFDDKQIAEIMLMHFSEEVKEQISVRKCSTSTPAKSTKEILEEQKYTQQQIRKFRIAHFPEEIIEEARNVKENVRDKTLACILSEAGFTTEQITTTIKNAVNNKVGTHKSEDVASITNAVDNKKSGNLITAIITAPDGSRAQALTSEIINAYTKAGFDDAQIREIAVNFFYKEIIDAVKIDSQEHEKQVAANHLAGIDADQPIIEIENQPSYFADALATIKRNITSNTNANDQIKEIDQILNDFKYIKFEFTSSLINIVDLTAEEKQKIKAKYIYDELTKDNHIDSALEIIGIVEKDRELIKEKYAGNGPIRYNPGLFTKLIRFATRNDDEGNTLFGVYSGFQTAALMSSTIFKIMGITANVVLGLVVAAIAGVNLAFDKYLYKYLDQLIAYYPEFFEVFNIEKKLSQDDKENFKFFIIFILGVSLFFTGYAFIPAALLMFSAGYFINYYMQRGTLSDTFRKYFQIQLDGSIKLFEGFRVFRAQDENGKLFGKDITLSTWQFRLLKFSSLLSIVFGIAMAALFAKWVFPVISGIAILGSMASPVGVIVVCGLFIYGVIYALLTARSWANLIQKDAMLKATKGYGLISIGNAKVIWKTITDAISKYFTEAKQTFENFTHAFFIGDVKGVAIGIAKFIWAIISIAWKAVAVAFSIFAPFGMYNSLDAAGGKISDMLHGANIGISASAAKTIGDTSVGINCAVKGTFVCRNAALTALPEEPSTVGKISRARGATYRLANGMGNGALTVGDALVEIDDNNKPDPNEPVEPDAPESKTELTTAEKLSFLGGASQSYSVGHQAVENAAKKINREESNLLEQIESLEDSFFETTRGKGRALRDAYNAAKINPKNANSPSVLIDEHLGVKQLLCGKWRGSTKSRETLDAYIISKNNNGVSVK